MTLIMYGVKWIRDHSRRARSQVHDDLLYPFNVRRADWQHGCRHSLAKTGAKMNRPLRERLRGLAQCAYWWAQHHRPTLPECSTRWLTIRDCYVPGFTGAPRGHSLLRVFRRAWPRAGQRGSWINGRDRRERFHSAAMSLPNATLAPACLY